MKQTNKGCNTSRMAIIVATLSIVLFIFPRVGHAVPAFKGIAQNDQYSCHTQGVEKSFKKSKTEFVKPVPLVKPRLIDKSVDRQDAASWPNTEVTHD